MASVAGIHIDHNSFRLIALDGSLKKHKVVAMIQGELPAGENPVAVLAEALKRGAREQKFKAETIGLVVDSSLAAFRNLTLPFDDDSKIEEVLKFEIESELPQWSIDDVIVDYITLKTKPGVQSDLLVTALPKESLQGHLEACELAGLEANEAELDGTALFNAAVVADLVGEGAAHLLVHVGDASTVLVLVDGGKIASMRTIRAGAGAPAPHSTVGEEGKGVGEEDGEEAQSTKATEEPMERAERLAKTSQRLRREIMRTLSGAQLKNPLEELLVCGHDLPILLEESFDGVPARKLLIKLADSDQPLDSEFVVAYGGALREMGGTALHPHLRREELSFSGKFERLELPLAVLGLLLVTYLAVQFIIIQKQISVHENDMRTWTEASNNFLFPDPTMNPPHPGRLKNPSEELYNYAIKAAKDTGGPQTGFQELQSIRTLLERDKNALEIEVGTKTDYEQPLSALKGLMLVMEGIDGLEDSIGRYAFRRITANYVQGRRGEEDIIQIKLDMDFHAADSTEATEAFTQLKRTFEDSVRFPWFREFKSNVSSKPFENGQGLIVDGITIDVNPKLAPDAES